MSGCRMERVLAIERAAPGGASLDVILLTAAREAAALQEAMRLGWWISS